ncbi:ATP phosphoribosyltransferase regulatory subunit [Roseovarius sp. THAF27]|uniref:ATP phosphoribosyltransferase regulatory subunit n=1 Tax=Roseovarius sp. THAF27 TaxID=2587850 RepID=UPI0012688451|nr:ATP phosphoribosyltransferase regulatory subunit [Roseovarius sp. THAF27]QFT80070.1 ATP phosphoribosyltransferase regulatory subunit [Roseovarius sp. THAF27]
MGPTPDNRAAVKAEAARLRDMFEAAGAVPVETSVLQPADTLLDLYGEDIRARAYVTSDALRGEQMLRPDFTVPVVQMHMAHGAEPACYTYAGEVFRRQEDDRDRANEYLQVGFEMFDRRAPEEADARVFAVIHEAVKDLPLQAVIGDIGILMAAVDGLETTERRKVALRRHIWRPRRFRALIERFSGRAPVPQSRAALLKAKDPMASDAPMIGLRGPDEIAARIKALREDAGTAPLAAREVELLDAVLAVRETADNALEQLRDIAVDMPAIAGAVEVLAKRLEALERAGLAPDSLEFEASYGRTQMEYYDGFVFGFSVPKRPDLPPVATGGRYDALTRRLGGGHEIPAVGGVIRPDQVLALGGGA